MEIESYKEKMTPERRKYRKMVYLKPLLDFMETENETLKYKCADNQEATNCSASLKAYIEKNDLTLAVWRKRNEVFVIKA